MNRAEEVSFLQQIDRLEKKVDRLLWLFNALARMEMKMSVELDTLKAAVARNGDVVQSAITLLQGISQMLKDAIESGNPADIAAAAASLSAETDALAAAVAENTPAA